MNRNALMIYLKNLRDLEFAKNKIKQIYNREQKVYDTKVAELKKTNYLSILILYLKRTNSM